MITDTSIENAMCVHMGGGSVIKLREVKSDLLLLNSKDNNSSKIISAYSYLTLVKASKVTITKMQLKRADAVRGFRKKLGYLRYKEYFKLL